MNSFDWVYRPWGFYIPYEQSLTETTETASCPKSKARRGMVGAADFDLWFCPGEFHEWALHGTFRRLRTSHRQSKCGLFLFFTWPHPIRNLFWRKTVCFATIWFSQTSQATAMRSNLALKAAAKIRLHVLGELPGKNEQPKVSKAETKQNNTCFELVISSSFLQIAENSLGLEGPGCGIGRSACFNLCDLETKNQEKSRELSSGWISSRHFATGVRLPKTHRFGP